VVPPRSGTAGTGPHVQGAAPRSYGPGSNRRFPAESRFAPGCQEISYLMKTGSMTGMEPVLSIVATIISSVALIGVAVGLILQGRQLKANQIQVMREMHLELMRVGINNPIVSASVYEGTSPEDFPRDSLINLSLKFLETGYSLKAITTRSVALQAARLFESEYVRAWWTNGMRDIFEAEAGAKSEKEFFTIVDSAFQDVMQNLHSASRSDIEPSIGESA
jgi:hypothetical protein